ncbi:hypothetical protein FraQA3DRAFT_0138, partial [Frankia sp. QA3]
MPVAPPIPAVAPADPARPAGRDASPPEP